MFLIPIEKHNPTYSPARVVQGLIVLNVVIFVAELIATRQTVFAHFGFVAASPRALTLFSHMFVHAGFLHLLGNMFFLWMFGDNVEDVLGHAPFIGAYVICGLGAVGAEWMSDPHSAVPMIGASGAISGVVGLYAVFFPNVAFDLTLTLRYWELGSTTLSCKAAVGVWIAEQCLLGVITSLTHSMGIAFWAHVGGFLTGLALGGLFLVLGFKQRFECRVAELVPNKQIRRRALAASAAVGESVLSRRRHKRKD